MTRSQNGSHDKEDSNRSSAAGPLTGLRVIEIGTLVAAPFAIRVLAEFGAEVIKIEPRDGDPLRRWRVVRDGTSLWWYVQSRNKKSITLDLKAPRGIAIARKLISTADVLVENLRPGALERLGLSWDDLRSLNSNLIFVRISGFGQTGPMKDRPGFGAIGEAMGGIRYTTGEPDRPPSRTGISLGDSLAGLQAIIGALMALLHVKNGGEGQVVDVALFESVFALMESTIPEYTDRGLVRERTGGRLPGITPSNTYKSRDDCWVVIGGNTDTIFRRMMHAIGREDLAADPTLQSNDGRAANKDRLDGAISAWAAKHTLSELLHILERAEVPSSRIYNARDIVEDPQYQARGMILSDVMPDVSPLTMPGIAPKLSATPGQVRWIGPSLGAHNHEVLSALGYDDAKIVDLKTNEVI
jgi:crotonobetainyl-CoA:carnitine CoA-transferase CaiB-like acyl-CoA transferase